jgi:hypothetical protein
MRQASKRWVRVATSAPCGKPRRREGRGSLPALQIWPLGYPYSSVEARVILSFDTTI